MCTVTVRTHRLWLRGVRRRDAGEGPRAAPAPPRTEAEGRGWTRVAAGSGEARREEKTGTPRGRHARHLFCSSGSGVGSEKAAEQLKQDHEPPDCRSQTRRRSRAEGNWGRMMWWPAWRHVARGRENRAILGTTRPSQCWAEKEGDNM